MVLGREVCYGRLSCFADDSPNGETLERPLRLLPWPLKVVNTGFLLYTQENYNSYQVKGLMIFMAWLHLLYNKDTFRLVLCVCKRILQTVSCLKCDVYLARDVEEGDSSIKGVDSQSPCLGAFIPHCDIVNSITW